MIGSSKNTQIFIHIQIYDNHNEWKNNGLFKRYAVDTIFNSSKCFCAPRSHQYTYDRCLPAQIWHRWTKNNFFTSIYCEFLEIEIVPHGLRFDLNYMANVTSQIQDAELKLTCFLCCSKIEFDSKKLMFLTVALVFSINGTEKAYTVYIYIYLHNILLYRWMSIRECFFLLRNNNMLLNEIRVRNHQFSM